MSTTPAGDWFAARDRERTHAMDGEDGSPGCWSWHPACSYGVGAAEALREMAAELERRAGVLDTRDGREFAAGMLRAAADLARNRAQGRREAAESDGTATDIHQDSGGRSDGYSPAETDALTAACEALALELPKAVPWLKATQSQERIRAIAFDAAARALDVIVPMIRADERERIAAVISPAQLRKLADWFDTDDEFKTAMFPETWPQRADEVQQDLRAWADLLEGRPS